MEVDRERVHAVKLQKELDQIRLSTSEALDRHQRESRELQTQIGEYRQHLGALQGNLQALSESRDFSLQELNSQRARLEEAQLLLATSRSESESRLKELIHARQSIGELGALSKPSRAVRKNKSAET